MKPTQGNALLYFGDKNVSKVSGIWKALHISISIAVAINAFITSMAAGNMFQTFKYNCILFCTDIVFEKEIVPTDLFLHTTMPGNDNLSRFDEITENSSITTLNIDDQTFNDNETSTEGLNYIADPQTNNLVSLNKYNSKTNIPKKENGTVIFKNQTHIFQNEGDSIAIFHARIDVRKLMFPSNFWCNFVLSVALMTFIFATFCTILLAMCSKGGKGRNNTLNRPQNMVYPILVSSILLGLLNLVSSIVVKNGMDKFCANFEIFTGQKSCSPLINKFTIHERQEHFFFPYLVLSHAFNLTVILFIGQIIVTFLRIIYAVDYQLYAYEVGDNDAEHDFEIEDGQILKEGKL